MGSGWGDVLGGRVVDGGGGESGPGGFWGRGDHFWDVGGGAVGADGVGARDGVST